MRARFVPRNVCLSDAARPGANPQWITRSGTVEQGVGSLLFGRRGHDQRLDIAAVRRQELRGERLIERHVHRLALGCTRHRRVAGPAEVLRIGQMEIDVSLGAQLFIDESASSRATEQRQLLAKVSRLRPLVNMAGATSGLMILLIVGWVVYLGLNPTQP
jgi:hypothetical protein